MGTRPAELLSELAELAEEPARRVVGTLRTAGHELQRPKGARARLRPRRALLLLGALAGAMTAARYVRAAMKAPGLTPPGTPGAFDRSDATEQGTPLPPRGSSHPESIVVPEPGRAAQ